MKMDSRMKLTQIYGQVFRAWRLSIQGQRECLSKFCSFWLLSTCEVLTKAKKFWVSRINFPMTLKRTFDSSCAFWILLSVFRLFSLEHFQISSMQSEFFIFPLSTFDRYQNPVFQKNSLAQYCFNKSQRK